MNSPDAVPDSTRSDADPPVIGWREWVGLPELGIAHIKAKIDTGARTSALHTFSLEVAEEAGVRTARFGVHPFQRDSDTIVWCRAPVIDERSVRDSGGHREWRFVIATQIEMAARRWPVEITLTARDNMLFRMLVGRTAMRGMRIDPTASFVTGVPAPGPR
ncbi:ribosomal protein S6 modification protein [Salinisphaera orenii MK-B5]|uniref:Ribosomal protein S6 modification protein n=2 Tax=Salinisphaera orenii TaxID=856731 RepID=A0A423PSZ4_9GAMM|nr:MULTISPECIES: RimK/LysX family protein [Salinisphaera]ROO25256.1 ribosomal protein S6 modification protein [Salinisphaera halophila YIM 95161]ROO28725.1 ribosomal protein S6 modification protein [Salinisphaera orenii MK-B5]